MKKFAVTILAFIYLGISSGIAMNLHYCMGKISSVDFFKHNDKCSKCGMKTSDGCCKDVFKIVKLSDSHNLISNDVNIFSPVALVNNFPIDLDNNLKYFNTSFSVSNNSPPRPPGTSRCILNCTFRI